MIIVETNKEKEQFLEYWNNEESKIIPIWEDLDRHPMNNGLSFLYVRFLLIIYFHSTIMIVKS
jgi:hypothetical protein